MNKAQYEPGFQEAITAAVETHGQNKVADKLEVASCIVMRYVAGTALPSPRVQREMMRIVAELEKPTRT